jgi:hypothetical protein
MSIRRIRICSAEVHSVRTPRQGKLCKEERPTDPDEISNALEAFKSEVTAVLKRDDVEPESSVD